MALGTPPSPRARGVPSVIGYVFVRDEKPNNTAGGTFLSGDWRDREINTIVHDTNKLASVSGNKITLEKGNYIVNIEVPALRVGGHIARLFSVTDNKELLLGTNEFSKLGINGSTTWSRIKGQIILKKKTTLKIQHQCFFSVNVLGFGGSVLTGSPAPKEIYTTAEFIRVGDF